MKKMTSLYDCQNARHPVPPDEYVYCSAGHKLGPIHKRRVDRNRPLRVAVCQNCPDLILMGEPWIRGEEAESLEEALKVVWIQLPTGEWKVSAIDTTKFTPEQKYPIGIKGFTEGQTYYYVKVAEGK